MAQRRPRKAEEHVPVAEPAPEEREDPQQRAAAAAEAAVQRGAAKLGRMPVGMSLQELVTLCISDKFKEVAEQWVDFFNNKVIPSNADELVRFAERIRPRLAAMTLNDAADQVVPLFSQQFTREQSSSSSSSNSSSAAPPTSSPVIRAAPQTSSSSTVAIQGSTSSKGVAFPVLPGSSDLTAGGQTALPGRLCRHHHLAVGLSLAARQESHQQTGSQQPPTKMQPPPRQCGRIQPACRTLWHP
jgi:hypothetical protein